MKILVGSSSRDDIPLKYYKESKKLLNKIFVNSHELVFGACNHGLMGASYSVACDNNCNVIGIYPEVYEEDALQVECEKISVKTVSERTENLIENSDILLFLPGGIGTLYELFTAIESKRANEHNKPIIVYNCCGFYDNLLLQFDKMNDDNFISSNDKDYLYISSSIEDIINYLEKMGL